MELKTMFSKIQIGFDWLQDAVSPTENRWLVFMIAVGLMLLSKAGGAHGLALLIALIYIMYFVTFRR